MVKSICECSFGFRVTHAGTRGCSIRTALRPDFPVRISLEPRLFVLDIVLQLWREMSEKKSGMEGLGSRPVPLVVSKAARQNFRMEAWVMFEASI